MDTHVRVLLLEDLFNRSPVFSALVVREETPSPLTVGCPKDGLLELTRQHCVVLNPRYGVVLLLAAGGGPDLLGSPLRLGVPHQSCLMDPLMKVHAPRDPCPNLLGLADAQCIHKNDVG